MTVNTLEFRDAVETALPAVEPPRTLSLEPVDCPVCQSDEAEPVAVGEDFEHRSSAETFLALRCLACGLVYLNPRPSPAELARIYPATYRGLGFAGTPAGAAQRLRRRAEARRLRRWCRALPADARILDVGCGDGQRLGLLRALGRKRWQVEGIEPSPQAARAARATGRGVTVHEGRVQDAELPSASYDLALLIGALERLDDPVAALAAIRNALRPGGRVVVVSPNAESVEARLFRGRHWGGYDFPRRWSFFAPSTLRALAERTRFEVEALSTRAGSTSWVRSLHHLSEDLGAPPWIVDRFGPTSLGALSLFTAVDAFFRLVGRGALLQATLRRPGHD